MMNKVPQNSLVGHQQNPSDGYLNSAFAVISHAFKFVSPKESQPQEELVTLRDTVSW